MTLLTPGIDLEVTPVKPTTQKGQRIIRAWSVAQKTDIFQSYKKPSSHKVAAFNDIKKEMEEAGGSSLRMTGAGCDYFSCAYKVWDVDGNPYIIYHTPTNRYAVRLN